MLNFIGAFRGDARGSKDLSSGETPGKTYPRPISVVTMDEFAIRFDDESRSFCRRIFLFLTEASQGNEDETNNSLFPSRASVFKMNPSRSSEFRLEHFSRDEYLAQTEQLYRARQALMWMAILCLLLTVISTSLLTGVPLVYLDLPWEAARWMGSFDEGAPVEPFSFFIPNDPRFGISDLPAPRTEGATR